MNAPLAAKMAPPATDWPADGLESIGRCPVCGTSERVLLHPALVDGIFFCAPGRWQMFRCNGCGCGYLDPRPTAATIGLAYASYYTHAASDEPRWMSAATFLGRRFPAWRNAYLKRRFPALRKEPSTSWAAHLVPLFPYGRCLADRDVRHLPTPRPNARLVDIGCGDGNFVRLAEQLGYAAEGLEFDAQAVAAARAQGLTIHLGGLPETGLATAAYDAVTLSQVIEHVHDPLAALRECARLLRPGGTVWVATPNVDAPGHRRFGPHWRGLEPPRHLVLFNAAALTRALAEAGFGDISLQPVGPVSGWFTNASQLIVNGIRPPATAKLSLRDRLLRLTTDWRAYWKPEHGEELIAVAVREA